MSWQDYAFLTRELSKFVDRQDWDMLLNLLDQRAVMQKQLESQTEDGFVATDAVRKLIGEILREEQEISRKIRHSHNQARQKQKMIKAYDAYSAVQAGSILNRGT